MTEKVKELDRRERGRFGTDDWSRTVVSLYRRGDRYFRVVVSEWDDTDDNGYRINVYPSDAEGNCLGESVAERYTTLDDAISDRVDPIGMIDAID